MPLTRTPVRASSRTLALACALLVAYGSCCRAARARNFQIASP